MVERAAGLPSSGSIRIGTGNMLGSPMVGAVDYYRKTYGVPACHEVVVRIPPKWRHFLNPHEDGLGLLGAKFYPNAFIGDLVRTMASVIRVTDDDPFVRAIATAGIDSAISTVARLLLRIGATPKILAIRGQEAWSMFHDSGRVIATCTDHEYVSVVDKWVNHDAVLCRITMEVRRRIIERTGLSNVTARRERCVGWGHESCICRVRWD